MIYEGHEFESADATAHALEELNQLVPVDVIERSTIRDGLSNERPFLLLQRRLINKYRCNDEKDYYRYIICYFMFC